ncbi:hypothetical protein [Desulfobulbus alkaliphilus]|uniref:hypothetical protein n=1 Tax=Desulfobulbus alkaliphilus TaxID=869814 RepID=UPI0019666013|nr:hypothetical protein [Desulfobulbus alkaliphilus]MBM9537544.1 hypothetical protein [Desulfobulbus alkaliphilus]
MKGETAFNQHGSLNLLEECRQRRRWLKTVSLLGHAGGRCHNKKKNNEKHQAGADGIGHLVHLFQE